MKNVSPQNPLSPVQEYTVVTACQNCWIKSFIITALVLSIVAIMVGALALTASLGSGLNSLSHLSAVGEINSGFMIAGGGLLFLLSTSAWGCQLKREKIRSLQLKDDHMNSIH